MIWPFAPFDAFVEGLEFRTDVQRAFSSGVRARLSGVPKRRFEHEHRFTTHQYESARLLMRASHPADVDVPDWADFRSVVASAGEMSLAFDNASPQLTSSDSVIVWQDEETYEELSISGSTTSGLTLSSPLTNSYPDGRVLRLLQCYSPSGLSASHPAGPILAASVEWLCHDDSKVTADDSELSTYQDDYLLDDCPVVGVDALPESMALLYNEVSNSIAKPYRDSVRAEPKEVYGLAWQPQSRSLAYLLRRKLLALNGRQKAFWLPSFNNGLTVVAPISNGASLVTIRNVNYSLAYPTGGHVYMRLRSGTTLSFEVTSSTPAGSTEVLSIDPVAPQAIALDDIELFCTMTRMHLAQDRIEWLHRPGVGAKVVTSAEDAGLPGATVP